jgi:hypothetical protein
MPERIRLSRGKGWRMPPNTVKVDRSTRWGNPFRAGDIVHRGLAFTGRDELVRDAAHAVQLYAQWLLRIEELEHPSKRKNMRTIKGQLQQKFGGRWIFRNPCHWVRDSDHATAARVHTGGFDENGEALPGNRIIVYAAGGKEMGRL